MIRPDLERLIGPGGSGAPEGKDIDDCARYALELEATLRAIKFNAEAHHAGEDGKERALAVIAGWAADPASVPEGVGPQ